MEEDSNITSLYDLINFFHEHHGEGNSQEKQLFKKLYASMFGKNGTLNEDLLSGEMFIGEEISPNSRTYMNLRPQIYGTILIAASLLGFICCLLLFWFVGRKHKVSPSSARVLVLNLAATCLVFLSGGVPMLLVENVFGYGWKFGQVACQIHRYVFYSSFYLMAYSQVGLNAYFLAFSAYPQLAINQLAVKMTAILILLLWVLVFLANMPNFLGHGVDEKIPGVSYCFHLEIAQDVDQAITWTALQFVFTYAVPGAAMTLCTIFQALIGCFKFRLLPGEYLALQGNSNNRMKVTIVGAILTLIFCFCWGPDKIFSLLLLVKPQRMGPPLLITSDVMMCLAYCQPTMSLLVVLTSRIDDHVTFQEVKSDQSKAAARPVSSCRGNPTEGSKDDAVEPMMISSV